MQGKYSKPHADIARAISLAQKRLRKAYSLFEHEVDSAIQEHIGPAPTTSESESVQTVRSDTPDGPSNNSSDRAALDLVAVEREIDKAKDALLNALASGVKPERAYLNFAIKINERVGDQHLYPGDATTVPMEEAARTIKVANEMLNDKRYSPRTLEMLNDLDPNDERLTRADLFKVSDFIQNSKEIDSIFRGCGELLSETEIDTLTRIIAEHQSGGIDTARIQILLEHLAVLAARDDVINIAKVIKKTRKDLYRHNPWAVGELSIPDWIDEARENLSQAVTVTGDYHDGEV